MSTVSLTIHTGIDVEETLGEHPLGLVQLGIQQQTQAPVYIRTYRVSSLKLDAGSSQAFLQRLDEPLLVHDVPTVAELVAWGRMDGGDDPWFAWRLPAGRMLFDRAEEPSVLSPHATLEVVLDLADAVANLRARGESFGPLTPDRVWLCEGGGCVLLALDDALRRHEVTQIPLVRADQVWHMPPEAEARSREVLGDDASRSTHGVRVTHALRPHGADFERIAQSETTHVWQLAAIAYFCLAGRHPFHTLDDPAEGMTRALQMVAAPLDAYEDHPVVEVLVGALQADPERRFESVAAFTAAFQRAIQSESPGHPSAPGDPNQLTGRQRTGIVAHERRRTVEALAPSTARRTAAQRKASGTPTEMEVALQTLRHTVGLWRLVALVFAISFAWLLFARQQTSSTLVVTSDPPGLLIEEAIGHSGVILGRTPLFLRDRAASDRVHFRVVAPNGARSETLSLSPSAFEDLGVCRAHQLRIVVGEDDVVSLESTQELAPPTAP